jgi:hypothetical protein
VSNDPLEDPRTAYGDFPETHYKAELELSDRYQAFTAELLRLALLGIAASGFLYQEVFVELGPGRHPAKSLASWGVVLFGVSTLLALIFRYCSSEALRLYLEGLRFHIHKQGDKATLRLSRRGQFVVVCIVAKAGAALALAVGASLMAFAFFVLLR